MRASRSSKLLLNDALEALANEHRRSLVYRLRLHPASITKLAKEEKLSLPAIHRHIKVLEGVKLVQRKKIGRTNFLAIDRTVLSELSEWIHQYHAYWGDNKETLENYIAEIERSAIRRKKSLAIKKRKR